LLASFAAYVVDAIEKNWAKSWKARGWKKADKQPALNADLWAAALDQLAKHKVKLVWVKGHASNEGNNRCDEIAVAASRSGHLLIDEGYEQAKRSEAALI
jgi:ribonuclease HI